MIFRQIFLMMFVMCLLLVSASAIAVGPSHDSDLELSDITTEVDEVFGATTTVNFAEPGAVITKTVDNSDQLLLNGAYTLRLEKDDTVTFDGTYLIVTYSGVERRLLDVEDGSRYTFSSDDGKTAQLKLLSRLRDGSYSDAIDTLRFETDDSGTLIEVAIPSFDQDIPFEFRINPADYLEITRAGDGYSGTVEVTGDDSEDREKLLVCGDELSDRDDNDLLGQNTKITFTVLQDPEKAGEATNDRAFCALDSCLFYSNTALTGETDLSCGEHGPIFSYHVRQSAFGFKGLMFEDNVWSCERSGCLDAQPRGLGPLDAGIIIDGENRELEVSPVNGFESLTVLETDRDTYYKLDSRSFRVGDVKYYGFKTPRFPTNAPVYLKKGSLEIYGTEMGISTPRDVLSTERLLLEAEDSTSRSLPDLPAEGFTYRVKMTSAAGEPAVQLIDCCTEPANTFEEGTGTLLGSELFGCVQSPRKALFRNPDRTKEITPSRDSDLIATQCVLTSIGAPPVAEPDAPLREIPRAPLPADPIKVEDPEDDDTVTVNPDPEDSKEEVCEVLGMPGCDVARPGYAFVNEPCNINLKGTIACNENYPPGFVGCEATPDGFRWVDISRRGDFTECVEPLVCDPLNPPQCILEGNDVGEFCLGQAEAKCDALDDSKSLICNYNNRWEELQTCPAGDVCDENDPFSCITPGTVGDAGSVVQCGDCTLSENRRYEVCEYNPIGTVDSYYLVDEVGQGTTCSQLGNGVSSRISPPEGYLGIDAENEGFFNDICDAYRSDRYYCPGQEALYESEALDLSWTCQNCQLTGEERSNVCQKIGPEGVSYVFSDERQCEDLGLTTYRGDLSKLRANPGDVNDICNSPARVYCSELEYTEELERQGQRAETLDCGGCEIPRDEIVNVCRGQRNQEAVTVFSGRSCDELGLATIVPLDDLFTQRSTYDAACAIEPITVYCTGDQFLAEHPLAEIPSEEEEEIRDQDECQEGLWTCGLFGDTGEQVDAAYECSSSFLSPAQWHRRDTCSAIESCQIVDREAKCVAEEELRQATYYCCGGGITGTNRFLPSTECGWWNARGDLNSCGGASDASAQEVERLCGNDFGTVSRVDYVSSIAKDYYTCTYK